uniref:Uncharacterized protein n=2 Tax=Clastoptera arizonana TaxID=38151 RepID=A0A1B6DEL0_9HEMI
MATKMHAKNEEDDDEDLTALRIAALKTIGKKQSQTLPSVKHNVVFKKHSSHPNLITIIPVCSDIDFKKPPQVVNNSWMKANSQMKVAHQTVTNDNHLNNEIKVEEVSTKFSRFEDTDSDSDDESIPENKLSESSEVSDPDYIALLAQEDDSLEALMTQMEQEIGDEKINNEKKKIQSKNKKLKSDNKIADDTKGTGKLKLNISEVSNSKKNEDKIGKKSQLNNFFDKESQKLAENSHVEHILPEELSSTLPEPKMLFHNVQSPRKQRSPYGAKSPDNLNPTLNEPLSLRFRLKSKSPLNSTRLKSPVRLYSKQTSCNHSLLKSHSTLRSNSPLGKCFNYKRSPDRRSLSPYTRNRSSRSPVRKQSPSTVNKKDLRYKKRSKEFSPTILSRRSRRSRTPPLKRWSPDTPRRFSPRYHRSPMHSYSPKRYSRSPSPIYYLPSSVKSPILRKRNYSHRRSITPSPCRTPPRYRSVSPKKKVSISEKRYESSKRTMSPKRKHNSPARTKKFVSIKNPLKRCSLSPKHLAPLHGDRVSFIKAQKHEKSKKIKEEIKNNINNFAKFKKRASSVSASPSPPKNKDFHYEAPNPKRYKSPLCRRDSHSKKNTLLPDEKNISKNRRNQNRKIIDDERNERDKKSHMKKESFKHDVTKKKSETSIYKKNDLVLEARRKKFESNNLVEPISKRIRLKNSPIIEDKIESKKMEHSKQVDYKTEDLDLDNDVLDLGAELWSSNDDEEQFIKSNNSNKKKLSRSLSPRKDKSLFIDNITLLNTGNNAEFLTVNQADKNSDKLKIIQTEDKIKIGKKNLSISPQEKEIKDEVNSDLRTELSRKRAERLTKAGSVYENLPTRLVQSAFEDVMGKKKVNKSEDKDKEPKKYKNQKSSFFTTDKTDSRRVLVLKRTEPVRLISQTEINNAFSEGNKNSSCLGSDEKIILPIKRKLPIHFRLGVVDDKKQPQKIRKVKLKHSDQV